MVKTLISELNKILGRHVCDRSHLNEIIEDIPATQNEIKQELFLIRNSQAEKTEKIVNSTSYAQVTREKKKNDDAKNEKTNDHKVKENSRNSRNHDQRTDKRNKDDWYKEKRYTGSKRSWSDGGRIQRNSEYSKTRYDKPQYGRYNG